MLYSEKSRKGKEKRMRIKKWICLLAILLVGFGTAGCSTCGNGNTSGGQSSGDSTSEEPIVYHTVTFKQDGYEDVIRQVADGEDLTDIPEPHEKPGYTVKWVGAELTNVRGNLTLYAVETVNVYTLTYNVNYNYATLSSTTQRITYGTEFTLKTPYLDPNAEWTFVKWVDEETLEEVKEGTYLFTKDITIKGVWKDKHGNFY
jgi:hypothetical protein